MQGAGLAGELDDKDGRAHRRDPMVTTESVMVILGLDIGKTKFDACLLGDGAKQSAHFPNTETGFAQLAAWLAKHRPPEMALHACMEATGNYGLALAAFLHADGATVSIVNPKQIKAFAEAELARNKTDKLDAALIARFCRTQNPPAWTPPAKHLRELREMVRRCAALKEHRTQEINRHKAGCASPAVRASIERALAHLNAEIDTITRQIHALLASDRQMQTNYNLLRTIPGIGEVSAAVLLAEIPNIAEFSKKGVAAFAGLSPTEASSGARNRTGGISRIGNAALRSTLYLGALSARTHNPRLAEFVARMTKEGRPNKVILIAVARKLLLLAQAIIQTQKPFDARHAEPEAAPA